VEWPPSVPAAGGLLNPMNHVGDRTEYRMRQRSAQLLNQRFLKTTQDRPRGFFGLPEGAREGQPND
jgi:hypothetical protein